MASATAFLFCLGAAWLAYVYLGYPLLIWLWGRLQPVKPIIMKSFLPSVSVLISARNEEKDIGWKIRETLNWDYPRDRLQLLVASDASEDGTDFILQGIRDPRLTYIRMPARSGKNAALNRLTQLATGELLLFTDANTHVGNDRLRCLVTRFADARVGSVTGVEQMDRRTTNSTIEYGVSAFLAYDALVKSGESTIGSVLVCDGALFCMRRELFSELDPELANDLELPLKVAHAGYWRLCELQAQPRERSTYSAREEFSRRRRICGQGILAAWRLRRYLNGLHAFQFLSCKLLRWLSILPLLMMLISSVTLRHNAIFAIFLTTQVLVYGMALLGGLLSFGRGGGGRLLPLPFFFLLANIAAFAGVLETCFGRRFRTWDVAVLSRGHEQPGQA